MLLICRLGKLNKITDKIGIKNLSWKNCKSSIKINKKFPKKNKFNKNSSKLSKITNCRDVWGSNFGFAVGHFYRHPVLPSVFQGFLKDLDKLKHASRRRRFDPESKIYIKEMFKTWKNTILFSGSKFSVTSSKSYVKDWKIRC